MRIAIILAAALLLLSLSLTASAPRGRRADFSFAGNGSVATLDPAAMSWVQDLRLAGLLYEGLYATDPATLRPAPACAASVEVDATRTRYAFDLRPEARWSNGDAVTADDFVFAWRRAIEPGTAADYAFFLHDIVGVAAYVEWRLSEVDRLRALPPAERAAAAETHQRAADRRFAESVELRAAGPRRLEMTLRRPVAYWLDVVAFPTMVPLHRASLERFRRVGATGLVFYDDQWVRPGRTHYNGPFALAEWRFKRELRLTRNEHYRDRARIKLCDVTYCDISDENTAWLMYETGRLDWLTSVETPFAAALAAQAATPPKGIAPDPQRRRGDVHTIPAFGTYFYSINCAAQLSNGTANPFADPRVRRAFSMAVDRAALVEHLTRRGERPATALVSPDLIPGYPQVDGLGHDPAAARRALAEAGYPEGRDFPLVELLFNSDGEHGLIAESVAQMWQTALGVRTRLIGKEVQSFREDKRAHRFMLSRGTWYGDYFDPTSFLDTQRTGNGNNDSAFSDAEYDRMLDAADRLTDPAARLAALADAERRLVRECVPILPLFQFVHVSMFDAARVRGMRLNSRLVLSLKDVEVVR